MSRYKKGYKSYSSTARKASLALKIAQTLASQHTLEYKSIEIKDSGENMENLGDVVQLLPIIQGTDDSDRVGNEVKLQTIQGRFRIIMNESATASLARVLIVKDLDNSGSTPTINEILGVGTDYSDYLTCAFKNHANKRRFIFLFDKVYTLSNSGNKVYHEEYYKKVPLRCSWTASTATATTNNQVFFVYLSNEATNFPTIRYYFRSKFTDD